MALRSMLLVACAVHLCTSFLVQRGPLPIPRTGARPLRSGLMLATDSDVKVTIKPPSTSAAGSESADSATSSNIKIKVRPKTDPAPQAAPVDELDDSTMTVTVKAPTSTKTVVLEEQPKNKGDKVQSEEDALLLNATQGANCSKLLVALQAGANPNIRDPAGRTPLHFCAGVGLAPACMLLIHFGAQLDVRDEGGLTPLHMAAGYANAQTLKVLVMAGADATIAGDKQGTPLEVVTALGEYQYQEVWKKRKETKNPMERLKKKDEKLEKLKKCMEVLEDRDRVMEEAVWEDELAEVLKTLAV